MLPLPLAAAACAAALLLPGLRAQADPVEFGRDVRPLLADKCFACHGPDETKRKAGLRLDVREGAFARLKGGRRAIVAGDPDASEMVRRIFHDDVAERMPPAESGRELSDAERGTLRRWIAEGAVWEEHWSFQPIRPRPAPNGGRFADRERNWIDAFVFARLAAEGLAPTDEADRSTLIRRVTLDLTGLPPTPEEVAAFVADEGEDAYEQLVDRLLASPRYGEHEARYWLDAARYGDTHGLHLDNYREMWPYRDWVVAAFNRDQPYDQFVVEQLAGDLLPDATLEQRIATGFVRAHVTTSEGGSIEEEVYVRNVVDRVDTLGTVFLGLTVGCAACHDHKFDPIAQKDYYQLFAFLNNEDGNPLDGNAKAHAPVVKVPRAEQAAQTAELDAERVAVEAEIAAKLRAFEYREPAPEPEDAAPAVDTLWVDDELPGSVENSGPQFSWVTAPVFAGARAMARRGDGLHQHFFANGEQRLRVGAGDLLFAYVWIDPTDPPREIMLQWNGDGAGDWGHRAYWGEDVIAWGDPDTASRRSRGALPAAGRFVRLEVPAQEVGFAPGAVVHGIAFTQHGGSTVWDAAGIRSRVRQEAEDYVWIDDEAPGGAKLQGEGANWQWVGATDAGPAPLSGARALRRSMGGGLNQDFFTGAKPPLLLRDGDRLFAHVWLDPNDPPQGVQLQFNDGSWEHRARWGGPCHGPGRADGADFVAGELPAVGEWVRLEVGLADVGLKPGAMLNGWAFTQTGGTVYWDRAGARTWAQHDERHLWSLAAWTAIAATDGSLPQPVRDAASAGSDATAERSDPQRQLLRDHYVRHVFAGSREVFDPLHATLEDVQKRAKDLDAQIPTTLVMEERAEPRDAFLLRRGQYDLHGDKVERVTPAFLPPMDAGLPRDRLGLARWLVDPSHPLTARVAVNRFWQQVFGIGLVKTSEDFGNQGEPPSHPALLDELARRFVDGGFGVKALLRQLVTSATYRQSSRVGAAAFARDPENRLLARGPRHRLDAEVIRDQALAVSGLLVEQVGGPGVKPPQPSGLWKAVGYVGSNTSKFEADHGADKVHRRSLYTFWKRTAPPPQMITFDAPSREACRVRRERTNTPLQALVLMNDPQFVECARAFAERIIKRPGDDAARIDWALLAATGRRATAADRADVMVLLEEQRAVFAAAPERAQALISIGELAADAALDPVELAAWTMAANLLLNLDEVVTKR